MYILYDNFVEDATITASSEYTDYKFSVGLIDDRLSRVSRTTGDTSQYIRFVLTSALNPTDFLCVGHNITSGATLTLKGYSAAGWGTADYTKTLTWGADYIYNTLSASAYQYWSLEISDASNPDGYIEISKIFLGTHLACYMDTGIALSNNSTSTSSKSTSMQLFGDRGIQYKAGKFVLSNVDRSLYKTFWNIVDIVKPFWVLFWEESLTVEPPFYCNLMKPLDWVKENSQDNTWTVNIEIEECF